jgi:CheY-like chemotaxis protein
MDTIADPKAAPILVVEDWPGLGSLMVRHLLEAGYSEAEHVFTADAAMIWLMAHWQRPRAVAPLVVMDLSLSPRDSWGNGCLAGLEVVRRWPATRILFVSGYDLAEVPDCPPGAPYARKPLMREEFVAVVADVLARPPWRLED